MNEIYKKLATFLDNLPSGYPGTETGVELRILERLFSAPGGRDGHDPHPDSRNGRGRCRAHRCG